MKLWSFALAALLAAGCAKFEPRPISPEASAGAVEARALDAIGLRTFLETNVQVSLTEWPLRTWDLDQLTLAAFYFNPDLTLARAQWVTAYGGEQTAAQRPNPTLNLQPGFNATTMAASPWIPLGYPDILIETAGKRGYRRAQAAQLAQVARLNIATIAWRVRGDLRSALVDFAAAGQREGLLQTQAGLQEQILRRLDQQIQAGAVAPSETIALRIALDKIRLDLADTRRQRVEARARVAQGLGIPLRRLEGLDFALDLNDGIASAASLTTAEVRRAALCGRADVLAALAEYAAAQATLQLEVAKQYPDVHLQPGYQFDQGDSKWSLGVVVELPILSHNLGPIAEAKGRRLESAARFNALQTKVLGEIDRAEAVFHASEANLRELAALAQSQKQRQTAVAAQLQAGASDQIELLSAQLESAATDLLQLDGRIKLRQAVAALEDAVQRPLPLLQAAFAVPTNP